MTSLENKFDADMHSIYVNAKKELRYNASRFMRLVAQKGVVQVAKQLIAKDGDAYGFEVLWEHKRLDLSVEAHVIKDEYKELFTKKRNRYL